jgi:glycosyltransferase involved in cell wall biosynthesis
MISVCMATHDGAAYVEQQLRSILPQLAGGDEIVLVDDHSSDGTLELVKKIGDERIRVHRNDSNRGVVPTFEQAIRLSSGDLVFLSDQDDIWYPGKVDRVSRIFMENSQVTLVMSDARVIDDKGDILADSLLKTRGGFAPGIVATLIRNRYSGCLMAFRRSLAEKFLPFPKDIPMHDMWIGLINAVYGKVHFIAAPLIAHRRHESNTSPDNRQAVAQMLVWRWRLFKNLCLRVLSR